MQKAKAQGKAEGAAAATREGAKERERLEQTLSETKAWLWNNETVERRRTSALAQARHWEGAAKSVGLQCARSKVKCSSQKWQAKYNRLLSERCRFISLATTQQREKYFELSKKTRRGIRDGCFGGQ